MISIILITYNGEKYVEKAVQSVLNQTLDLSQIQLIAVDDKSSDGTVSILKRYRDAYPDTIIVVEKKENSVIAKDSPRDIGITYSSGEYIMFLDQDDWYLPHAFETLQRKMDEDKSLDYIEYCFNYVDDEEQIIRRSRPGKEGYRKCIALSENEKIALEREKLLPCSTFVWSKIYRKDFLITNNIHHNMGEQYAGFGDNYFSGLVELNCQRFAYLYEPMYNYYVRTGSWSHAMMKNNVNQLERLKVGFAFLDECKKRGYDVTKHKLVEFIFFRIYIEKVFWKLLFMFDPVPADILQKMKANVETHFPNYKSNDLLFVRRKLRIVIEQMDYEWNMQFFEDIKAKYSK